MEAGFARHKPIISTIEAERYRARARVTRDGFTGNFPVIIFFFQSAKIIFFSLKVRLREERERFKEKWSVLLLYAMERER